MQEEKKSVVTHSTTKNITVFGSIDESVSHSQAFSGLPKRRKYNDQLSLNEGNSDTSSQRSDYEIPWNLLMSVDSKSLEQTRKFGATSGSQ